MVLKHTVFVVTSSQKQIQVSLRVGNETPDIVGFVKEPAQALTTMEVNNMSQILDRNYTDVPKLVQKYLKQLKWLETRLRKTRPKEGAPDAAWMSAFGKAVK